MYRPTVRYDDLYGEYINNLFNATHLDRSQIIRAALFIAGHTEKFSKIIDPYLKRGMSLPEPLWNEQEEELWLKQKFNVSTHEVKVIQQSNIEPKTYEQKQLTKQPSSKPKVFTPAMEDISITVGRRQYPPRS